MWPIWLYVVLSFPAMLGFYVVCRIVLELIKAVLIYPLVTLFLHFKASYMVGAITTLLAVYKFKFVVEFNPVQWKREYLYVGNDVKEGSGFYRLLGIEYTKASFRVKLYPVLPVSAELTLEETLKQVSTELVEQTDFGRAVMNAAELESWHQGVRDQCSLKEFKNLLKSNYRVGGIDV